MEVDIPRDERLAFTNALTALNDEGIPYVVGGAFALNHYTGIWRYTKDLDIFLLPEDVARAMAVLQEQGYHTRIEAENWLAKAFKHDFMIDLIFGEGNWLRQVDEEWMRRSRPGHILGVLAPIAPIEEIIRSKAFVAERGRFDGADIMHLIEASNGNLDWRHLLASFDIHWEILFSYLNQFRYVYPGHKHYVPEWLMKELIKRLRADLKKPALADNVCQGPLLDRLSYIHDIDEKGYHDPRDEYAVELGYSLKDVKLERRWAARKVHRRELHIA